MTKRLANVKTRNQTGLDYVIQNIDIATPFGKKILKEIQPYLPGEEKKLEEELTRVEQMLVLSEKDSKLVDFLAEIFMDMKDATFTMQRSRNNTLSVVEIFEVKTLLLKMEKIMDLFVNAKSQIPKEFLLEDLSLLLDILDPGKERMNTFYIYDEFSETLASLRKSKRDIEIELRKAQRKRKDVILMQYGVALTPKFDCVVSKSNREMLNKVQSILELEQSDEDYMSVTFVLKKDEETYAFVKALENINEKLDEEETKIREYLSRKISEFEKEFLDNCQRIGKLDITLAKALYAIKHNCRKPVIAEEHILEFTDGRHLMVEDILLSKKKEYCPVSVVLHDGVTCITGANMGGKTVSLKLIGLVAMLTQYGFFVPCKTAKVGLSNYMQILIGDSQSVERGLSSFGSEMEELKEIMDNSKDRSILLIDEIASGTNPVEGLALTKSLVEYLKGRPYISIITTHFDSVTIGKGIVNLQVMGLANADFLTLDREIKYANRKERINVIGKYMDYRLQVVQDEKEIPKDALNIAKMLGISDEIIERAKEIMA